MTELKCGEKFFKIKSQIELENWKHEYRKYTVIALNVWSNSI